MSYQSISKKLLSLLKIQVSNQTEEDIYLYGIETLLSVFINSMILCILAFLFHLEKEILCYMIFFIPLRTYGGGIHAKNHLQCIALFVFLLLLSIIVSNPISQNPDYFYIILSIALCRLGFSFLQNRNSKSRNTKIALIISIIISLILTLLVLFNYLFSLKLEYYITISTMGILVQTLTSISLLFPQKTHHSL